ncbi:hypothetical protein ACHWQZ_G007110 [Mnemiopsis leidyi]
MCTLRPFTCKDLFRFNRVNFDPLTENYGTSFYLQYLVNWPEYCTVAESPSGQIMGYILGKSEGQAEEWHGHVTTLTVSPQFRRLGIAHTLMNQLEKISENQKCYFVDLFVRVSNDVAKNMYKNFGYSVYRQIVEYYAGGNAPHSPPDEDAYDMRKALSRDPDGKSLIAKKKLIKTNELFSN